MTDTAVSFTKDFLASGVAAVISKTVVAPTEWVSYCCRLAVDVDETGAEREFRGLSDYRSANLVELWAYTKFNVSVQDEIKKFPDKECLAPLTNSFGCKKKHKGINHQHHPVIELKGKVEQFCTSYWTFISFCFLICKLRARVHCFPHPRQVCMAQLGHQPQGYRTYLSLQLHVPKVISEGHQDVCINEE
ncbi:hypothetical protein GH733_013184 [Mirounga leonina]|nr:hypothetical protein GH733_013184 [Mirounga leonina]